MEFIFGKNKFSNLHKKKSLLYFNLKLKCKVLYSYLFHEVTKFFENHNFNALNLFFKNVITARRLKCCGMEDRKVVAYGYRRQNS